MQRRREHGQGNVSEPERGLLGRVREREPDSGERVSDGQLAERQLRRRIVSLGQSAGGMGNHVCGGGMKHGRKTEYPQYPLFGRAGGAH